MSDSSPFLSRRQILLCGLSVGSAIIPEENTYAISSGTRNQSITPPLDVLSKEYSPADALIRFYRLLDDIIDQISYTLRGPVIYYWTKLHEIINNIDMDAKTLAASLEKHPVTVSTQNIQNLLLAGQVHISGLQIDSFITHGNIIEGLVALNTISDRLHESAVQTKYTLSIEESQLLTRLLKNIQKLLKQASDQYDAAFNKYFDDIDTIRKIGDKIRKKMEDAHDGIASVEYPSLNHSDRVRNAINLKTQETEVINAFDSILSDTANGLFYQLRAIKQTAFNEVRVSFQNIISSALPADQSKLNEQLAEHENVATQTDSEMNILEFGIAGAFEWFKLRRNSKSDALKMPDTSSKLEHAPIQHVAFMEEGAKLRPPCAITSDDVANSINKRCPDEHDKNTMFGHCPYITRRDIGGLMFHIFCSCAVHKIPLWNRFEPNSLNRSIVYWVQHDIHVPDVIAQQIGNDLTKLIEG